MTSFCGEEIIFCKAHVEESVCVYFFLLFGLFMLLCVFSPALHNIYFIRLWYDIAYLC